MQLSIVLPCYNEEANIERSVRDVSDWMDSKSIEGKVIVVDDGSRDKSLQVLESLKHDIPRLHIVKHEKNGGYGVAVRSGLDAATTEWIAFMDSDGQFKARDFEALLPFVDRYAFINTRRAHRADPLIRNVFGKILGLFNFFTLGIWVRDINSGMKMFRKTIWPRIRPVHGVQKLFNAEVFMRLKEQGIPYVTVVVPHYPRTAGTPTGGSLSVIKQMFEEMKNLRKAMKEKTMDGKVLRA